jgi:hypothetical protein
MAQFSESIAIVVESSRRIWVSNHGLTIAGQGLIRLMLFAILGALHHEIIAVLI